MKDTKKSTTQTTDTIRWYPDSGIYGFHCVGFNKLSYKKSYPRTRLCRYCSIKKAATRRKQANVNVTLVDNLVVTTETANRFRKKGRAGNTPHFFREVWR